MLHLGTLLYFSDTFANSNGNWKYKSLGQLTVLSYFMHSSCCL